MSNIVDFDKEILEFKSLFNELEKAIKKRCESFGVKEDFYKNSINKLKENNDPIIRKFYYSFIEVGEIRNFVIHNNTKKYSSPICPSPDYKNIIKDLTKELKEPKKIINSKMCIKIDKIYTRSLNDNLEETIKEMIKNMYTHIPIIKEGKVIGVFSENTLLDIINKNGGIITDKNTKIGDYSNEIKITNHSLEVFPFISKDTTIYEVENIFENYFKDNKRTGCVFVTNSGKENEKILGMLTAWDVLGE